MKNDEPTRVRLHGTKVTNPAQEVDPGQARVEALRGIVENAQYAKIDGIMVDTFSASAILGLYDALSEENKSTYRGYSVGKMANLAFRAMNKAA